MYIISIYDDKNNQYSFCNIAASVYFAALWTTNQAISLYWFKKKIQLRYEFQDNHLSSCAAGLRNAKPLQSPSAQCVSF